MESSASNVNPKLMIQSKSNYSCGTDSGSGRDYSGDGGGDGEDGVERRLRSCRGRGTSMHTIFLFYHSASPRHVHTTTLTPHKINIY